VVSKGSKYVLRNVLQVLLHLGEVVGELCRKGRLGRGPYPTRSPSAPMTCRWPQPLVPGCVWGDDQHVGLSYATAPATIDKGMARLAAYVAQLALLSVGEGTR